MTEGSFIRQLTQIISSYGPDGKLIGVSSLPHTHEGVLSSQYRSPRLYIPQSASGLLYPVVSSHQSMMIYSIVERRLDRTSYLRERAIGAVSHSSLRPESSRRKWSELGQNIRVDRSITTRSSRHKSTFPCRGSAVPMLMTHHEGENGNVERKGLDRRGR